MKTQFLALSRLGAVCLFGAGFMLADSLDNIMRETFHPAGILLTLAFICLAIKDAKINVAPGSYKRGTIWRLIPERDAGEEPRIIKL